MFVSAVLDQGCCAFALLEENGFEEDRPDFLSFDPTVVAEQFTLMDAVSKTHTHTHACTHESTL